MCRTCKLQHTHIEMIEHDEVIGSYFFCDLKSGLLNATEQYNTDQLMMDVHTSPNRIVGLEAVFVGETYKKQINKANKPDCGTLDIQRTGVIQQIEMTHINVYCNASFVQLGSDT